MKVPTTLIGEVKVNWWEHFSVHPISFSLGSDYTIDNVVVGGSLVLRTARLLPSQSKPVPIHLGREEQVQVPCSKTQHAGPHGIRAHNLRIMSPEPYR